MIVVEAAKAEVGYAEQGNNNNKFGAWYGLNNQPWCAIFVSWCYHRAGLSELVSAQTPKGFASCDAGLKWFTRRNKLVTVGQAQLGDIAFFQFDKDAEPDHVGIVAKNDGKKYIWTYEGNTSSGDKGSQANGDGVYLRKRPYTLVMGIARP